MADGGGSGDYAKLTRDLFAIAKFVTLLRLAVELIDLVLSLQETHISR